MPSREEKQRIRGIIEDLEAKAFNRQAITAEEIKTITESMKKMHFSEDSGYYPRLENLLEDLNEKNSVNITKPQPQSKPLEDKRIYVGYIGDLPLEVKPVYDHVFLSTFYCGKYKSNETRFKISHRFNHEGRIDLVDAYLTQCLDPLLSGAVRHLITIDGFQNIKKNWQKAEAFFLPCLPFEMIFYEPDFLRLEKRTRYQSLMKNGHSLAKELTACLRNKTIDTLKQYSLPELLEDDEAMYMLNKAASLMPGLEMNGQKLLVSYGPNN